MIKYFTKNSLQVRYLLFLLLIILAIIPRFIFLNNVPVAINNDEMHYVLNAKSFYVTGKDIAGIITPLDILTFKYPSGEMVQAELPYFLQMPIFGPFNFSLAGLAFPNALFGLLTVAVIFLITKNIFDSKTAFIAGVIAALNPWLIFVSRTSYEAGLAIPFFLSIIYLLLIAKGWKILLIIPVALLAFYSYIGTKIIFVPFMLLSILYAFYYVNKRQFFKQYLLLFLFVIVLTMCFLFRLGQQNGSRNPGILMPNSPIISNLVNESRKHAMSSPLAKVVDNKYSVYSSILAKNTFNVFSPYYLFVNGDYFFLLGEHGLFYSLDALFLGLGILMLFMRKRKVFIFLSLLICLSAFPQIVYETSYKNGNFAPHITLLIPFAIIIISFGIRSLFEVKSKAIFYLLIFLILIGYSISFLNFTYIYFFKFPLQQATFSIINRNLSRYISFAMNKNKPIIVLAQNYELLFNSFLFYSNVYNRNSINQMNPVLTGKSKTYKNVTFISCDNSLTISKNKIFIDDMTCDRPLLNGAINVSQLKDSGGMYRIYNDTICNRYQLPRYITNLNLQDLDIEKLTPKKFCETFIVAY